MAFEGVQAANGIHNDKTVIHSTNFFMLMPFFGAYAVGIFQILIRKREPAVGYPVLPGFLIWGINTTRPCGVPALRARMK